jgi:hypothetical protein
MTLSVKNFNAVSAAAQFWLKILVVFFSSSRGIFVTKIEFLWKPRKAKVYVMGVKID